MHILFSHYSLITCNSQWVILHTLLQCYYRHEGEEVITEISFWSEIFLYVHLLSSLSKTWCFCSCVQSHFTFFLSLEACETDMNSVFCVKMSVSFLHFGVFLTLILGHSGSRGRQDNTDIILGKCRLHIHPIPTVDHMSPLGLRRFGP